jgi:hypothetical protein
MGQIFLSLRDISDPICFGDEALENIEIWTVLRVCRFWRDVALSCSELWMLFGIVHSAFSRPTHRDADTVLRQTVQLTKDCITFSRSRLLHFAFHANENFLEAAQLLATESLRWKSVSFNNLPVLRALEPEVLYRLPNLYSLDLDGLGMEWDSQTRPLELFQQAPSLTKLTLCEFERPHTRFSFPWHQITLFTSRNLRQFLPILHLMPSLVELTSVEDVIEVGEIQDRILFPNLKRLEVTSNSPTTSQIFDALRTPQLTSLILCSRRGFSRLYAAAVAQMIKSSGCSPKNLSVSDYAVDSIFRILVETRDLKTLTVTNLTYPSELLSGLDLPRLRKLALRKCAPELALVPSLTRLLQGGNSDSGLTSNEANSLRNISIGFSSHPGVELFRSWKETARQAVRDSLVHVEFLDSLNCAYPSVSTTERN